MWLRFHPLYPPFFQGAADEIILIFFRSKLYTLMSYIHCACTLTRLICFIQQQKQDERHAREYGTAPARLATAKSARPPCPSRSARRLPRCRRVIRARSRSCTHTKTHKSETKKASESDSKSRSDSNSERDSERKTMNERTRNTTRDGKGILQINVIFM